MPKWLLPTKLCLYKLNDGVVSENNSYLQNCDKLLSGCVKKDGDCTIKVMLMSGAITLTCRTVAVMLLSGAKTLNVALWCCHGQ